MHQPEWMASRFEEHRAHLRSVAYRMLGSLSDADDAVQETWMRLSRAGADDVENLRGWLTTVVARVSLNMMRSRAARREEPMPEFPPSDAFIAGNTADVEQETLLADSVGVALLVVLERLTPAERLAFVLHDMFDLPFEEIASIVGRSPAAARQLASRARRRVRGAPVASESDLKSQRRVVDAFLAAVRSGDFDALVAMLDPDVVLRADRVALLSGASMVQGALAVAKGASRFARLARYCEVALVDGAPAIVLAPRGRLLRVLRLTVAGDRVTGLDVVADPAALRRLDLSVPSLE